MASPSLVWTVRAATGGDAPKEELLNRGHVPVSGDIAYLHTQRAVHFIDFGAPPLLCSPLSSAFSITTSESSRGTFRECACLRVHCGVLVALAPTHAERAQGRQSDVGQAVRVW